MLHATMKVNGKTYIGIGTTHTEARMNAQQLIGDKISGGLACVIRPWIRVEAGTK